MSVQTVAAAPPILIAEDNADDAFIIERALARVGLPNPVVIVRDGHEAVNYLVSEGAYENRALHPFPCLFLLDIQMPRMDGFDVLAWMLVHPQFNHLPVIILSGSNHQKDVARAKDMGADDYQVKPIGLAALVTLLKEVLTRWLPARA